MGSSISSKSTYTRGAFHSGSWYSDNPKELEENLESFLSQVPPSTTPTTRLRALICPHAGYSYSGPTAAFAYQPLRNELQDNQCLITTILVLHPAHHVYLRGCAVSGADQLETPVGNLQVDEELRREILETKSFEIMTKEMDEEEHSGEMQYPFLAHAIGSRSIQVLPVMCGALSTEDEVRYGKILSTIISRPNILTVCSSDFCHWGNRFRYQPTGDGLPIHQFIENLDRRGMDLIELQRPGAFADYLQETRNSICGRHAIAVWMRAVESYVDGKVSVVFVRYAQSGAVTSMTESSVSYAAATAYSDE